MRIHELKTWPLYFAAVVETDERKRKTVELRKDDRGYEVGDYLLLREYDPATVTYSGRETLQLVTHCLRDYEGLWLAPGIVAMSITGILGSMKCIRESDQE